MIRPARFAFPAIICLVLPIAVVGPHTVVPLGVAGAVALALDPSVRERFGALLRGPLAVALGCLFAWAAVSTAWAPHPGGSLFLVFQVAGVMVAGGLLAAGAECADDGARRRAIMALGLAGPVFLLLIGSELLDGGLVARLMRGWPKGFTFNPVIYDRAAAVAAIVAWPIAFALWRRFRPRAAIVFLLLTLAFLFELEMAAARLAFVVAAVVFAVSYWKPRAIAHAMLAVMLAGILVAPPILVATGVGRELPAIAQDMPDNATSVKHRLLIGQFVLKKIGERPLTGFGFDSSRAIPGGRKAAIEGAPVLPLHPHNGILQIWLELGLPGAVIAAVIVVLVLRRMSAIEPRGPAAMANAAFAAYITIAVISFGIWQNWWLMTAWIAATLAVLAANARPAPG
jgi:O-antigen ligase